MSSESSTGRQVKHVSTVHDSLIPFYCTAVSRTDEYRIYIRVRVTKVNNNVHFLRSQYPKFLDVKQVASCLTMLVQNVLQIHVVWS